MTSCKQWHLGLVGAFSLALIILGSGMQVRAAELTPANIRMDFIIGGKHAPWFVALEKGFYAKRGIAATIQTSTGSADTMQDDRFRRRRFRIRRSGDDDRRQVPRRAGASGRSIRLRRRDDCLA